MLTIVASAWLGCSLLPSPRFKTDRPDNLRNNFANPFQRDLIANTSKYVARTLAVSANDSPFAIDVELRSSQYTVFIPRRLAADSVEKRVLVLGSSNKSKATSSCP